jgi:hypothetical protein
MHCDEIDDDMIELYVLKRKLDNRAVEHLQTCPSCAIRVKNQRERVELIREAIQVLMRKHDAN